MFQGIDLSSDTASLPTAAMKQAMIEAPLGDEQKDEDPTTRRLERKVAELLAVGDAMFTPSATMANQIALLLLAEQGGELLASENSHLLTAESGASAVLSRVMAKPIRTENGLFQSAQVIALCEGGSPYRPKPSVISLENSTFYGGMTWSLSALNEIIEVADKLKLKKHLDGARILNASVASNMSPATLVKGFDTISLCLSKGLGCPVGAVLSFKDPSLRPLARHYKHLLGGAMRQSGMLAAAGIYALDNHVTRLAQDHQHAKAIAERLSIYPEQFRLVNLVPETNIVLFDWIDKTTSADAFYQSCLEQGLRFSRLTPTRFRAITHLNIETDDIAKIFTVLEHVIAV